MLKRTLLLASEEYLPRLATAAALPHSVPDLEPLFKDHATRRVLRQEGMTWFIDEALASLIHYTLLSNSYRPADILKQPDLTATLLASIKSKTTLCHVSSVPAADIEQMLQQHLAKRRSWRTLLDDLRIAIIDPTEYLVMTSYWVMHQTIQTIQNNYGLEQELIYSILKANHRFRNEVARLSSV